MAERLRMVLDNPSRYDAIVAEGMSEGGDLEIVTKRNGTVEGNPSVVIGFSVELADGTPARVQAVTTVKLFVLAAVAMRARYGEL